MFRQPLLLLLLLTLFNPALGAGTCKAPSSTGRTGSSTSKSAAVKSHAGGASNTSAVSPTGNDLLADDPAGSGLSTSDSTGTSLSAGAAVAAVTTTASGAVPTTASGAVLEEFLPCPSGSSCVTDSTASSTALDGDENRLATPPVATSSTGKGQASKGSGKTKTRTASNSKGGNGSGNKTTGTTPTGTAPTDTSGGGGASASASASAGGSGSGDSQTYTGNATFYTNPASGGESGCYGWDQPVYPDNYTVALNEPMWDVSGANTYPNPNCGKEVIITAVASGVTLKATILDECPLTASGDGCHWGSLDMTTGLFNAFNDQSGGQFDGEFEISWTCETCVDFPDATPDR